MYIGEHTMTLGNMLEDTTRRMPRKCAIKFQKQKFTFQQLNESANRLAHGCEPLGIKKGDRIGILSENCPEYIFTYFALAKLGGIVVPINHLLTAEEIQFIVQDCQVTVLFTSKKFFQTIEPILSKMNSVQHVVIINDPNPTKYTSFEKLLQSGSGEDLKTDITDEDLAVFIYTSGTTGHPKGAMLTHKNLVSNARSSAEAFQVVSKDKILLFLPMFHSFTFTVCVLLPVATGASIILLQRTARILKDITHAILFDRVTLFVGIPTVFNLLAKKPLPKIFNYISFKYISAIEVFISGSAPLPTPVIGEIERKFGSPMCEGYGLSEASPVVSVNPRFGIRKPGSIGLPIPGVQVKIVDPDMNELPVGEIGELAVKGENVMQGYYNRPEETKETIRDDWLLTGDIARIDEDGYIYIVDRKKDMLIVRGVNVYPREIEEVLYKHPKVLECAVIGVPDEAKGEVPKAIIAVQENETLTEREVREYCKEHLAGYKVPKEIEFRPSLPKTSTGKIMKRSLRGE